MFGSGSGEGGLITTMDVIRMEDFKSVQSAYQSSFDSLTRMAGQLKDAVAQTQAYLTDTNAVVRRHEEEIATLKEKAAAVPRLEAEVIELRAALMSLKEELEDVRNVSDLIKDQKGLSMIQSGDAQKIEQEAIERRKAKLEARKKAEEESKAIYEARMKAVKILVAACQQREKEDLAQRAMQGLLNIAEGGFSKQYPIMKYGGFEAAFGSMRTFPKNRVIIAAACNLTRALAVGPTFAHIRKHPIATSGRFAALLCKVLKGAAKDVKVQEAAAGALWPLNVLVGAASQDSCVREDGLRTLIHNTRAHIEQVGPTWRLMGALLSILIANPQIQGEAPLECAAVVKEAMTRHRDIKFDGDFQDLLPWVQASLKKLKELKKKEEALIA